jgi:Glucodextranase, domain B/PASTA domain
VVRLGALIAAVLVLAGCGGDDRTAEKPRPPVRLSVSSPSDTALVLGSTVQVSGTVSPSTATVQVKGQRAHVSGGRFSSEVALEPGPNVIDVAATARNRTAALTAFRVTREQRVTVPDLVGAGADDAERRIERRGLTFEAKRGGGFLDSLVPKGLGVCEQTPAAGSEVRRGSTVRVVVARAC